jgi:DNA invertase Pin-like site-specific DNA recombinase
MAYSPAGTGPTAGKEHAMPKPAAAARPVACYLRVSSRDQRHDSQRAEIAAWLGRNGIDLDQVRWYEDVESGRTMRRVAFDRLQADIHAGHVRTVVVYKVDRIARRLREGLDVLCGWVDRGVRFVSVTQQVDVAGAFGRMMLAMMLGLAEIEWEYRAERQTAGIAQAKARGVYRGRKPGTTKGEPDRARELQAKGLDAPEIAAALGVSARTVRRYLGNSAEPTVG